MSNFKGLKLIFQQKELGYLERMVESYIDLYFYCLTRKLIKTS